MNKPAKILCYAGLFGLTLLCFLYWTFPFEALKGRLITMVEQSLGGDLQVSIGAVDSHWITGVELHELAITDQREKKPVTWLRVEAMSVHVGLFSLLTGQPRARFDMDFPEGDIGGSVARQNGGQSMAVHFDEVGLEPFGLIPATTGLKLGGMINGDVECALDARQMKATQGAIALTFQEWKILKGSQLKLGSLGTLDLSELNIESLILSRSEDSGLELAIENGVATVNVLRLKGGDIEVDLTGKLFLEQPFANSRVNLKGTVKFSEKMTQVFPVQMLGAANPDDGSYVLELSGRVNALQKRIGSFRF